MRATRADWAATSPWSGLQDAPLWLRDPAGIPISGVIGLEARLPGGSEALADVAYSGKYSDLSGKPSFGSAAFVSSAFFQVAANNGTFQIGSVAILLGVQDYPVVFSDPMDDVPRIVLQHYMVDATGAQFYASVLRDTLTADGFTLRLNGIPIADGGTVEWEAKTAAQP